MLPNWSFPAKNTGRPACKARRICGIHKAEQKACESVGILVGDTFHACVNTAGEMPAQGAEYESSNLHTIRSARSLEDSGD
jgi:hypothetical protein